MTRRQPTRRSLLRFGFANVVCGWRRCVLPGFLLVLITVGVQVLGPGALNHHLHVEEARRANGARILVAEAERGVDATQCERLSLSSSVARAGASGEVVTRSVRPGLTAPTTWVTPGLVTILLDGGTAARQPSEQVLVGDGLGQRLLLEPTRPGQVAQVMPAEGSRTDYFDASVVSVEPAIGRAARCWVEMTPATFSVGVDVVAGGLSAGAADLQVRPLVFDGGPHRYIGGAGDVVPLSGATLVAIVMALLVGFRRIDLAMYRIAGFRRRDAMIIVYVERMTLLVVAGLGSTCGWLLVTGMTGSLPASVIAAAIGTMIAMVSMSSAGIAATTAVLGSRWRQVAAIREGA